MHLLFTDRGWYLENRFLTPALSKDLRDEVRSRSVTLIVFRCVTVRVSVRHAERVSVRHAARVSVRHAERVSVRHAVRVFQYVTLCVCFTTMCWVCLVVGGAGQNRLATMTRMTEGHHTTTESLNCI